MIEGLNDKNPRVFAHTLASSSNFIENASYSLLKENCNKIFSIAQKSLDSDIPLIKENALSVIAAIAEKCHDGFSDDEFLELANKIIGLAASDKQFEESKVMQG